jgi:hypothetical protein
MSNVAIPQPGKEDSPFIFGTAAGQAGAGNVYTMGSASSDEIVGRWILDFRSSSFSGSLTIVGRARGSQNAFVGIPYTARYLNGAVGSDAVQAGNTAITNDSIISVISDGLEIGVNAGTVTSGTMSLDCRPCSG